MTGYFHAETEDSSLPSRRGTIAWAVVFVLCVMSRAFGENLETTTTIDIKGIHCQGCAKKAKSKLESVAGVATADVDAKTGRATVTPSKDGHPSPRAMWEAVETAKLTPTKLAGPDGTFTEKPKA